VDTIEVRAWTSHVKHAWPLIVDSLVLHSE
jgi:hypothetical protein